MKAKKFQKNTKIYLNDKIADSSKIKISAKDGPQEYNFIFRKDDQIAKYSLVCLPVNFPPLNINITNSSMVADGNIFTSVFIVPKIVKKELEHLTGDPDKKIISEQTLGFIQNFPTNDIDGSNADVAILDYIKENRSIVATMDKELKNKIKQSGSSILSIHNDKIVLEN